MDILIIAKVIAGLLLFIGFASSGLTVLTGKFSSLPLSFLQLTVGSLLFFFSNEIVNWLTSNLEQEYLQIFVLLFPLVILFLIISTPISRY